MDMHVFSQELGITFIVYLYYFKSPHVIWFLSFQVHPYQPMLIILL